MFFLFAFTPCSDLGAHIDGWVATQAQTIVVAPSFDAPVSGPAADAIAAARTAFEAALRLIRPGRKISEVAPILAKIVESYGCNLVEGVMSHQMRQFVIDGCAARDATETIVWLKGNRPSCVDSSATRNIAQHSAMTHGKRMFYEAPDALVSADRCRHTASPMSSTMTTPIAREPLFV